MFWVAIIIIFSSLIGIISTRFLGDDNPIEEAMEEIIRFEVGVDCDLTPNFSEEDTEDPLNTKEKVKTQYEIFNKKMFFK